MADCRLGVLRHTQAHPSEMIAFAVLVEVVPLSMRSTTVGIFLFVMNNIGGNLPIVVEPIRTTLGFREALYIFYGVAYLISSLMFFFTIFVMDPKTGASKKPPLDAGHDNRGLQVDPLDSAPHKLDEKVIEMSRL